MENTQEKVICAIIADILGIEDVSEISRDAEFIADLNASFDEIQKIIKTVEERFDVELGVEDPEEVVSVAQLIELVEETFI